MRVDFSKLKEYGFILKNNLYEYQISFFDDLFTLFVFCNKDGVITDKVIDNTTKEEYYLVKVDSCTGEYVGKVKKAYSDIISDIKKKCFDNDTFKCSSTNEVIKYIKETYNNDPEFLWEKYDNNAVFRHNDNKKWYGVILSVSKDKLGLSDNKEIDAIVLKNKPEVIDKLVCDGCFFRGYHMNKKHWFTIPLDGSISLDIIKKYIDESFICSNK